jgi:oligopeptide/dipeptide ABC transporter ATP-binding protein
MGLLPAGAGAILHGEILLNGRDVAGLCAEAMRKVRGRDVGMVFQEPMTALNPLFCVGDQVAEALRAHQPVGRKEAWARAVDMLRSVGIPSPEQRALALPHQLSGGMRQRVMIAMALICEPSVLICDEPTTALDVTVQAQVLDLLRDLRDRRGMAIVFITHDMGVIAEMADRVLVMYAGRKIEDGTTQEVIRAPAHPYTCGLISSIPAVRADVCDEPEPLPEIPGVVPALTALGPGCAFEPRCAVAGDPRCKAAVPPMFDVGGGHAAACWLKAGDATP